MNDTSENRMLIAKLDSLYELIQSIKVDRAGDVAATNTRLDYIEKHLGKIDGLSQAQGATLARIQVLELEHREFKTASTDRETRLRVTEDGNIALKTLLDKHVEEASLVFSRVGLIEKTVFIGMGVAIILQVVLSPWLQNALLRGN